MRTPMGRVSSSNTILNFYELRLLFFALTAVVARRSFLVLFCFRSGWPARNPVVHFSGLFRSFNIHLFEIL